MQKQTAADMRLQFEHRKISYFTLDTLHNTTFGSVICIDVLLVKWWRERHRWWNECETFSVCLCVSWSSSSSPSSTTMWLLPSPSIILRVLCIDQRHCITNVFHLIGSANAMENKSSTFKLIIAHRMWVCATNYVPTHTNTHTHEIPDGNTFHFLFFPFSSNPYSLYEIDVETKL